MKNILSARLLIATDTVSKLLLRITELENDQQTSPEEKLVQIKKIKEEITKVGTEIDNLKREIKLLNNYRVN